MLPPLPSGFIKVRMGKDKSGGSVKDCCRFTWQRGVSNPQQRGVVVLPINAGSIVLIPYDLCFPIGGAAAPFLEALPFKRTAIDFQPHDCFLGLPKYCQVCSKLKIKSTI